MNGWCSHRVKKGLQWLLLQSKRPYAPQEVESVLILPVKSINVGTPVHFIVWVKTQVIVIYEIEHLNLLMWMCEWILLTTWCILVSSQPNFHKRLPKEQIQSSQKHLSVKVAPCYPVVNKALQNPDVSKSCREKGKTWLMFLQSVFQYITQS